MKVVSLRTGLSPHVIRVWERRYQAVSPGRSENGRRFYTEKDIVRLQLLKELTDEGHNIGSIAGQPEDYLMQLKNPASAGQSQASKLFPENKGNHRANEIRGEKDQKTWLAESLVAVTEMNQEKLFELFSEARAVRDVLVLLENYISPLLVKVGEEWQTGELSVAHEHFTTAVVRTFLESVSTNLTVSNKAPTLLITTPSGQLHELGAMLANVAARYQGWNTIYMGPSTPAREICETAALKQVEAVALSIVHPLRDPLISMELKKVRRLLPDSVILIVGGRAAASYTDSLTGKNSIVVKSLTELVQVLSRLAA